MRAFLCSYVPSCGAENWHNLLQVNTDSAAPLTKRVIVDNNFYRNDPRHLPARPTNGTYAMVLREHNEATDISPDWFSRNVFKGNLTVPFSTFNIWGEEGSLYYIHAAQLQGEVEITYMLNHVQRTDTGWESHNVTIIFLQDDLPIAVFFSEFLSSGVLSDQVFHGKGSWTVSQIWPAIGALNISVPAYLLLRPPAPFFPQFSGLVTSKLAKRFDALVMDFAESDISHWDGFAVDPEGAFDFEQLNQLEGQSDFELQMNQFTIRCVFATANKVIAKFEVSRAVSPADKVALANIRGSGIWTEEHRS